MIRILIYSMLFVHSFHFGVSAQSEHVNLNSRKDSISFALGVENAVGILKEDSNFEALDKTLLVQGFQSNLSNSPATDCESTIQKLLGPQGNEFDKTYIKEGSYCVGRLSAFYFYMQMDQMDVLSDIDLTIVTRGFKQGLSKEDTQNLSLNERTRLIAVFGQQVQAKYLREIAKNDAVFWSEVLSKPGVEQVGETGIYFETIEHGSGGKPTTDSDIEAHYILTNTLGDTLDSSFAAGQSLKINLSSLIEGWRLGFPALEKGGKYRLFIPFEKAYKNGHAQAPQGALCYYIEFIDFGDAGTLAKPIPSIRRVKKN